MKFTFAIADWGTKGMAKSKETHFVGLMIPSHFYSRAMAVRVV